ncbi:MAG: type I-B CRISPR-associated endonuclease Cas1 [Halanaerobiaceae bacterium]|nr:type I-B CRISPR-associated endonuclease Cas1 [Halanaerobiaceae bacterium]
MKKTIYLFSDGELKRKDNTIFFESEKGRKYIPVENTDEIYVFGEVDVNKRFLEFITQSMIIIHFFNYYGYYIGSYYPREHMNSGYMILKQAEHYIDPGKRISIARKFVKGASQNMLQVIRYYRNRGKELTETEDAILELANNIQGCNTIEELMAIEGNIREYYYGAFDIIIDNPDFVFEKRSKRPPKNYLNTLISFGNSMMYTVALSEIYKTHLDPRIGFLHATNFRRFTLNLDVAEIFKPIIVDRLIFTLVKKNMITEGDFEKTTKGILLTEKGRMVFLQQFEDKLKTTIKYKELGRNVSYRRLVRLELYKLEKHLIGESEYIPYSTGW